MASSSSRVNYNNRHEDEAIASKTFTNNTNSQRRRSLPPVTVRKFNRLKPVPDIERYEYLLPCDARSAAEIGYRLQGEAVADILEKQADLLCYLKSTIIELKSKLIELSTSHQ